MTKEEYEKLLKSDYWKGYSYSLIKERNFTCEDCHKIFYNERNKLQVHHLVYRDVNPWSYKPDEVVVLCEECHMKRHGLCPPSDSERNEYIKTYSYGSATKDEKAHFADGEDIDIDTDEIHHSRVVKQALQAGVSTEGTTKEILQRIHHARVAKQALQAGVSTEGTTMEILQRINHARVVKQALQAGVSTETKIFLGCFGSMFLLVFSFIGFVIYNIVKNSREFNKAWEDNKIEIGLVRDKIHDLREQTNEEAEKWREHEKHNEDKANISKPSREKVIRTTVRKKQADTDTNVNAQQQKPRKTIKTTVHNSLKSASELCEQSEQNESTNTSETYKHKGESIYDTYDRESHASAVRQAKQAGVSTEGTTMEILERINHASVVKQAKQAGVSTEGTTMEILERINDLYINKPTL